jgi:TetR/AcrR family tetracycline transcriptional repressor
MDDAIRAIPESRPDGDWADWLLTALVDLRNTMLRHRDGARIVSGARLSLRRGDFSESAISTLVDHGIELQQARLLVLAGERFTGGYVLEEQAPTDATQQAPDVDELLRRFPVMTQAIGQYFSVGRTSDDLYRDTARLVLGLPPANLTHSPKPIVQRRPASARSARSGFQGAPEHRSSRVHSPQ